MKIHKNYALLTVQWIIWICAQPLLHFFLRVEIKGLDNVKKIKTNIIFVPNHLTELDVVLMEASLPFFSPLMPIYYVTRGRSFYDNSFLYSTFVFNLIGGVSARTGLNDYRKSLKKHIKLLRKGANMCIFPEGRTSRDGKMNERVKGGVAALVAGSDVSILPVGISGHYKMTCSDILLRRRKVVIHFGEVITKQELFEGYDIADTPSYEEIVQKKVKNRIQELIDDVN